MSKQLDIEGIDSTGLVLPSAKTRAGDKAGLHSWTNFYAAYSEEFVNSAIEKLDITKNKTLLDPFVGSGTTLISAAKYGVKATGIDLDPFACLLSRAKIATKADKNIVQSLLAKSTRTRSIAQFSIEAEDMFSSECLCYAHTVYSRIYKSSGLSRTTALEKLLKDRVGKYDSEVVALTSLCIASLKSAKLIQGSNPTWFRKPVAGELDLDPNLFEGANMTSQILISDLKLLGSASIKRNISVHNLDVSSYTHKTFFNKYDFLITSPPYLTRIDYVVKHMPQLSMLSGFTNIDVNSLRKKMIGTSKIVNKSSPDENWGTECLNVIEDIRLHSSYASLRYYQWTYIQYFNSIFNSLRFIANSLKISGEGILVIQGSYYKDLYIDLSKITSEMLTKFDCDICSIQRRDVKQSMRHLNVRRARTGVTDGITEDVIHFRRK